MLLELSGSHREGTAFLYFTPIVRGHEHHQALQALIGYGALTASSLCVPLRLVHLASLESGLFQLCFINFVLADLGILWFWLHMSELSAAVLQT